MKAMQKALRQGWAVLLAGMLMTAGCSPKETPPPKEITIEEMNAALAYIDESGLDYPTSVNELTNLPAFRGKVLPTLPDGEYFSIDPDLDQVIVEMAHPPTNLPDAFPHRDSF